jgi:DNA-binding response OmpR family regulator
MASATEPDSISPDSAGAEQKISKEGVMSELSVLVVEDDAVLNRVIQAALERAGYRTYAAETCADGLALATKEMPGLLVLDVNLPDGTAWGLLEDIRRDRPDDDVPVIVMSSNSVSRVQLRKNGVDKFFPKPIDMGLFLETVKELLHPT